MGIFDRIINFNQYEKPTDDVLDMQNKMADIIKKEKVLLPEPKYYNFSKISLRRMESCHVDIQKVMHEAIKYYDFSVTEGWRAKEKQDRYLTEGTSKVRWPYSYHNTCVKHIKEIFLPNGLSFTGVDPMSLAIDIAPYPIDYKDLGRFHKLASIVKLCCIKVGVNDLDWGYDLWKWDFPHWQLTSYRKPKNELS